MKSGGRGTGIFPAEVLDLTADGFRLRLGEEMLSVPFSEFPWFQGVPSGVVRNVRRPSSGHLYWPDLDIDLAVDSIRYPDRFPLVSRASSASG